MLVCLFLELCLPSTTTVLTEIGLCDSADAALDSPATLTSSGCDAIENTYFNVVDTPPLEWFKIHNKASNQFI